MQVYALAVRRRIESSDLRAKCTFYVLRKENLSYLFPCIAMIHINVLESCRIRLDNRRAIKVRIMTR